jgi:hypothetical protein
MDVLDENIPESQRRLLLRQRVHVRQIGLDLGRKGLKDSEIIPLLYALDQPTLFTAQIAEGASQREPQPHASAASSSDPTRNDPRQPTPKSAA